MPESSDYTPTSVWAFIDYLEGAEEPWITQDSYDRTADAHIALFLENKDNPWHEWDEARDIDVSVLAEEALKGYKPLGLKSLRIYRHQILRFIREFLAGNPKRTTLADLRMTLNSYQGMQRSRLRTNWKKLVEPLGLSDDTDVSDVDWDTKFTELVEEDRQQWTKKVAEYQQTLETAFQKFLAWTEANCSAVQ